MQAAHIRAIAAAASRLTASTGRRFESSSENPRLTTDYAATILTLTELVKRRGGGDISAAVDTWSSAVAGYASDEL
jgi:hypothetical protein